MKHGWLRKILLAGMTLGFSVMGMTMAHSPVFAAQDPGLTVNWGSFMDQAFDSTPLGGGSTGYIPAGWANLPVDNPSGWPLPYPEYQDGNFWNLKKYSSNGQAGGITVQSGQQNIALSVPQALEDVCRHVTYYGTRGYWRTMMVITNGSDNEAMSWSSPVNAIYNSSLNAEAAYCSPTSNYSSNGLTVYENAPTVNQQTQYTAEWFAEEMQRTTKGGSVLSGDLSEISEPITVMPPATVSLSAQSPSEPVGQADSFTATATNVQSHEYIVIKNTTNYRTLATGQPPGYTDPTDSLPATDVHNTPQTDSYKAYVYNGSGAIVARSSVVSVTWTGAVTPPPPSNPTATISAYPPGPLTVGDQTTVTATSPNLPSNDYLAIYGSDNTSTQGSDGQATVSYPDTQNSPNTVTYNAYIYNQYGQEVAPASNNPATVIWNASAPPPPPPPANNWSVSLTATPQSLFAGQSTTLTATANQNVGPTPYYINIVDTTTGQVVESCGNGTACTKSFSESSATTQTFQADVGSINEQPGYGTQANSNTQTVVWQNPDVSLSVPSPSANLQVGQSVTMTATGTNLINNQLPPGDNLEVQGTDGFSQTGSGGQTSLPITDSNNDQPGSVTYTAYIVNSSNQVVFTGNTRTVTWTAPPSVSLTVNSTTPWVGTSVALTATTQYYTPGNNIDINIVDKSTGKVVGTCPTNSTQCTIDTQTHYPGQLLTRTYEADLGYYGALPTDPSVQHVSKDNPTVTWQVPSVTITASNTTPWSGQSTTITASSTDVPPHDIIYLWNTNNASVRVNTVTPPNTGAHATLLTLVAPTAAHTVTYPNTLTETYKAEIESGSGTVLSINNPTVNVTWQAHKPEPTGCVEYKPGYEWENGVATYNPQACPVPTPVNF